jgi:hypothetical protein
VPRIRSLLEAVRIELVKKAHDCQGNAGHRLQKGDRRLGVRNGRGWDNYCLTCGKRILEDDAARIAKVLRAIETGQIEANSSWFGNGRGTD